LNFYKKVKLRLLRSQTAVFLGSILIRVHYCQHAAGKARIGEVGEMEAQIFVIIIDFEEVSPALKIDLAEVVFTIRPLPS
jgi:hypothetical protein